MVIKARVNLQAMHGTSESESAAKMHAQGRIRRAETITSARFPYKYLAFRRLSLHGMILADNIRTGWYSLKLLW